ncbi:FAD binding domain-containing protein [Sarocladium implicatum]|nr:FAD binding domain-containing protein [Sarocladium implicatum]
MQISLSTFVTAAGLFTSLTSANPVARTAHTSNHSPRLLNLNIGGRDDSCRCLPGDACWPSSEEWRKLNETVDGRLVATVPIGSPCHDPHYDEDACKKLQDGWLLPQTHLPSSSSLMQPYFANQSCDPFTSQSTPCELGNYVVYSVDVAKPEHVAAALKFAQEKNIRPVVRSTGHDFLGRSSGAGGLGIWLWHLKDTEVIDYSDAFYSGPALKVAPGVIGAEAVEAAAAKDLVVVTGECPTVAVAGGFTQGGGHSALSTSYGLAADQTLEFEVVTAEGKILTASRTKNSDLYWALSGGGGGNYAVVMSATIRAHPAAKVGGAKLTMGAAYTTQENFDKAIAEFHKLLPAMIDQGASVVYYASKSIFAISPLTVVNSTGDIVRDEILGPFTKKLAELSVPASVSYSTLDYLDHYDTYMGPLPWGHIEVSAYQFGSRLIPKSLLVDDVDAFNSAIDNLTSQGVLAVGSAAAYSKPFSVDNAVLPAWRSAYIQLQLTTPWSNDPSKRVDMVAAQHRMTDEFNPQLARLTPGGGAYMNEADFREPNWKETWFGDNYERLATVKRRYDPHGLLYMFKGVGSDAWDVAADGRMCRT